MTEKHKKYLRRFIAATVCGHVDRCNACDDIFGLDRVDDCPKLVEVDTDEYNAFVVSFAEVLYKAVMQEKNFYLGDLKIDTTEILNLLEGE